MQLKLPILGFPSKKDSSKDPFRHFFPMFLENHDSNHPESEGPDEAVALAPIPQPKQPVMPSPRRIFPLGLEEGMIFTDDRMLKAFIKKDALKRRIRLADANRFKKIITFQEGSSEVELRCSKCPARISLEYKPDEIVVKSFDVQHSHEFDKSKVKPSQKKEEVVPVREAEKQSDPQQIPQPVKNQVVSIPLPSKPQKLPVPVAPPQPVIKIEPSDNLLPIEVEDNSRESVNTSQLGWFENWLKMQRMRFAILKNKLRGFDFLLVCSRTMLTNYCRYDELVRLDVLEHENVSESKQKTWHILVISCHDVNMHLLPVAVAIVRDLSRRSYQLVLNGFFKVTERAIINITTDESQELREAIKNLQDKGIILGYHLLTPYCIAKRIQNELKVVCQPATQFRLQILVDKALTTTNPSSFEQSIAVLKQCPYTSSIIERLLHQKQKVFHCQIPRGVFAGLPKGRSQPIRHEILAIRQARDSMPYSYLKNFLEVEKRLFDNSQNSEGNYPEELEACLSDRRLHRVKMCFERKLFECFTERYLEALKSCELLDSWVEPKSEQSKFVVEQDGRSYKLENMKCSCGEMERSGVACCHAIFAAIKTPNYDYSDLATLRWRRDRYLPSRM